MAFAGRADGGVPGTAMNLDMSAIGSMMAYAAPECEDKAINSDAIKALGWLLAERGAITAFMICLAALCKPASGRPAH